MALFLFSSSAFTQIYLTEDFSSGVPPTGWTQDQVNPLCQGWIQSADLRAWHEDELGVGDCDDILVSPSMDLSTASSAYVHFRSELDFANFLANHPTTLGNGETDLLVRVSGGAWSEIWTDCRLTEDEDHTITVELPAAVLGESDVQIGFRYFGEFAHETWISFVQVDASQIAPPPPPPTATTWNIPSLPGAHMTAPYTDDFEAWAGTAPAHMTLNATDTSFVPDVEAWCDINGSTFTPNSGSFCLEMGVDPALGSASASKRNAMVLCIDGNGIANLALDCTLVDHGEEANEFDGIWISSNGVDWFNVFADGDWGSSLGGIGVWESVTNISLTGTPVDTTGIFYLGFFQEDNFSYANLDGIGVDDINIDVGGPTGGCELTLTVEGTCPGPMTFEVTGGTLGGQVALIYGTPGTFTQNSPSLPCVGTTVDVIGLTGGPPVISTIFNPSSDVNCLSVPNVPASACGNVRVQAVDLINCCVSNFVDI